MKRFFLILLTMMMWSVSCAQAETELRGYDQKEGYQYLYLGEFPQEADGTVKPILWRVLSVDDQQAYLLSEYILFNNRVHPDDQEYIAFEAEFNQTEMFKLLNGPFEGKPISKEEQDELTQRKVYMRDLEHRAVSILGRRVKILKTNKKKVVELAYSDDDDLAELLKVICGNDFFGEND